jgi:hypothetical protein
VDGATLGLYKVMHVAVTTSGSITHLWQVIAIETVQRQAFRFSFHLVVAAPLQCFCVVIHVR